MAELGTWLSWIEPTFCVLCLGVILYRGQFQAYRFLAALLGVRLLSNAVLLPLLFFHKSLHMTAQQAYTSYFYVYWGSEALEALFGFGIIVSVYRLAMAPLPGLERLGMIMFRWAGSISVALAVSIAIGPHMTSTSFIVRLVSQLQQSQSVLTLCMLVFVCFAIHPMGLSFRSKIFGVSLGLALMAVTDLVTAAWIAHSPGLYSLTSVVGGLSVCFTLVVWNVYFVLPEPERRMIMIPTTSPFFHWNEISKALGDAPGFVAVGPVTLDNFAPAELEVMRRASDKMSRALSA